MSRAALILNSKEARSKALNWIAKAPTGTRLEFKAPRRSLPQNDCMWGWLTVIAERLKWHGIKLTPADWKLIFLDALKHEVRIVPNLDGTGFVNLGRSSSDLGVEEMSALLEIIAAFAASKGLDLPEAA